MKTQKKNFVENKWKLELFACWSHHYPAQLEEALFLH